MKVSDLLYLLDKAAPFSAQAEWDSSGLVVMGGKDIKKIAVSLNLRDIPRKKLTNFDAIIVHHPPHFNKSGFPRKKDIFSFLAGEGISLIACHTNADAANKGFADMICKKLELKDIKPLNRVPIKNRRKIVVYIDEKHRNELLNAVFNAGAGEIGWYRKCSFTGSGKGTYLPLGEAEPFIGEPETYHDDKELRVEFEIDKSNLESVLSKIFEVHPYEEPIVEVYPFDRYKKGLGIGRVGNTDKSVSEFFSRVSEIFKNPEIKLKDSSRVKKVAVIPGSGKDFIKLCAKNGVDTLITADLGYHDIQNALDLAINIVEVSHEDSEKLFVEWVKQFLKEKTRNKGIKVETFVI